MIGRPARRRRRHALEAQTLQIQLVDEDIHHPDWIILGHIVVETFGKQRLLPAIGTLNEAAHTHLLKTSGGYPNSLELEAFSHSLSRKRSEANELQTHKPKKPEAFQRPQKAAERLLQTRGLRPFIDDGA